MYIGDDIQNVVLLLNTATPPLDDIRVRKAIIHAIDKKALVKKEMGGFLDPVDNVFPRSMPYCDVDVSWILFVPIPNPNLLILCTHNFRLIVFPCAFS